MPMGDELASTSLGLAQKSMEMGVELIKMLAPLVSKLYIRFQDEHSVTGEVTRAQLFAEAGKSGSAIMSDSNFLAKDAENIAEKAKKYGIPVSITGDGEKSTISFLERDKAVVSQILQETMQERMKTAPQEVKHFAVSEHNVQTIKEAFAKNGVECCFAQNANGQIYCQYQSKDAEKVSVIKAEFKAMRNEVADNLKVEPSKSGLGTITDTSTGKNIDLSQYGGSIKQYQAVNILQKEFGYNKDKAILAANKLCDDLHLNPKEFLARTEQLENLKLMKTNIRLKEESVLLKDTTFNAVHFSDGEHLHICVTDRDKSVFLTPAAMSREEMKKLCVTELDMSDEKAEAAVEKTINIDTQINSKVKETTIFRNNNVQQTAEIDRTSNNSFSVKVGTTKRDFDFDDPDLIAKLGKSFGITEGKAQSIINKAKHQSAFLNNIEKTAKSAKDKAANIAKDLKENLGKGVRK